MILMIYLRINR